MNSNKKQGFLKNIKSDFPASIVVFLVALPLCLGIAVASGAPPFSGLIAGIVGGIIVTLFSGSPLGVSGPAAGLIAIVILAIEDLGAFDAFLLAVLVSGVFQVILGFLKMGIIGYYFPSSVIKGMLSGIGITIILKQLPHAFGYDKDPEGDLAFAQMDGHTTFSELGYMLDSISMGALSITVIGILILLLWERPFFTKSNLLKNIKGPLVVVLLGVGLNFLFQGFPGMALGAEHLVDIPVSDSIMGFFGQFTLPDFTQWNNPDVYVVAITIAIVASLETLLCVEATDKLDPQKRITPTNQELKAQGVGNIISGLIGGLPITQVIVRSSANIQSGGKTKASAFFHGILLLICAFSIPTLLKLIPLASLAAILLVVGYKLAKPALFIEMYKKGKEQFIPFVITVIAIVRTDLLTGIGIGLVVAIFYILWKNFQNPYYFNQKDYEEGKPIRIKLAQDVTFLNKVNIMQTLNQLPDDSQVIIDGSLNVNIHPDVLEIIDNFRENAKTRGITVELENFVNIPDHDSIEHFENAILDKPKKKKNKILNTLFND